MRRRRERASESLTCCRERASTNVPLQGSPNEGKSGGGHEVPRNSERNTSPRRDPKMGALEIWDLGGKPSGEGTVEGKGPVEASKSVARRQEKPGHPT